MKLSLYNIQTEHLKLTEALIENGGEVTPELEEALKINQNDLQTKGVNYGIIIRELDAECSIIDAEIERLKAHKKTRVNSIERLKNNLSVAMQVFEVEKIESPIMKISFRKSESIEIEDSKLIHARFIRTKTEDVIDKASIKEAIKKGEIVTGAVLKENKNIQIK